MKPDATPKAKRPLAPPQRPPAGLRWLFRTRAKLMLAAGLLVVLPFVGIFFARQFERELLRSEEEALIALAHTLAPLAAGNRQGALDTQRLRQATDFIRQRLKGRVRVIGTDGRTKFDTGPGKVVYAKRRIALLGRDTSMSSRAPFDRQAIVGDPTPEDGDFRSRLEVKRALEGKPARFSRASHGTRGVRLYIAEPLRGPKGNVTGVMYLSRSTYSVMKGLYRVRSYLFRAVFGATLLALSLTLFFALTITRPLNQLSAAAGAIAKGQRGVALGTERWDELGDLAVSFNEMAERLHARHQYVRQLAANVSHEFKTPLSTIRGAAELLEDGAADHPEHRAKFLGQILKASGRLNTLVSRLLELSTLEATDKAPMPIDLRELLEEVCQRVSDSPPPIQLDYAAQDITLWGDGESLDTAFSNLVENARQASPRNVPVRVHVGPKSGGIYQIRIQDGGTGISRENLSRIWDRFFTTKRKEGGTGLGLAMVKTVVEHHGGEVTVQSEQGQGTLVTISLPQRKPKRS